MKKNALSFLLLMVLLVAACSALPPLVSLEASLSNPQAVTIYKAPT
jgi:starvation-inducible outer membrane lipoprotein